MDSTADDIRREMQVTRRRVRAEVGEVVHGARQFADWRYYPRHFPWTTLGVAAALGYVFVPGRRRVARPDPEMLDQLLHRHRLQLESKAADAGKKGAIAALAAAAGTALFRAGLTYATNQLNVRLNKAFAAQHRRPPEQPPEARDDSIR
jgi:hypothetical protein